MQFSTGVVLYVSWRVGVKSIYIHQRCYIDFFYSIQVIFLAENISKSQPVTSIEIASDRME